MTPPLPTFAACVLRLAAWAAAPAVLVSALGAMCVPTNAERWAVLGAAAVSWLASCAGAVPLGLAISTDPRRAVNAALGATAVRFLVVLAMAAPVLVGNWLPRTTFVLALVASYLLMLLIDSLIAVRMIQKHVERRTA